MSHTGLDIRLTANNQQPMTSQAPTTEVTSPVLVIPQLIVGLGNPGREYEQTRHNIGFAAVDALASTWQISLSENRKFQGLFGEGIAVKGEKIRLLKPLTYMNESGRSVRSVIDWFKLPPESVLVIYDDVDLPVGKIRLRLSGSAGGQKGMKSTIAHLGTQTFPRLRIGIGNPRANATGDKNLAPYVLGRFSQPESQVMKQVLQVVVDAVELSLKQGVEKAMSLYNNRDMAAT
jgi:peptidyl-tRNA hydrolase, PTH1 family